ncbi:MAG: phage holin family protein [Opitutaceae bacterium]|nr:phage holin family protein [Opitutaceae bacterium]
MYPLLSLLFRYAVLALGVVLAAQIVPGIDYDSNRTLVVVVLVMSLLNTVIKPLLVLFTLPFILITMGLGVILINALLFLFVGHIINGFHVAGFWSALGGALIVSLTHVIVGLTSRGRGPRPPRGPGAGGRPGRSDPDIIDV